MQQLFPKIKNNLKREQQNIIDLSVNKIFDLPYFRKPVIQQGSFSRVLNEAYSDIGFIRKMNGLSQKPPADEVTVLCVLCDIKDKNNQVTDSNRSLLARLAHTGIDLNKEIFEKSLGFEKGISINQMLASFPKDIEKDLRGEINKGRKESLLRKYFAEEIDKLPQHHILCLIKELENTKSDSYLSELSQYKAVDLDFLIHAPGTGEFQERQ